MPRVKIDTPGVTVELDANEVTIDDLRKQALDTFREATDINNGIPPGPAGGVQAERRGIADHRDPNGRSDFGFAPVKAETPDG